MSSRRRAEWTSKVMPNKDDEEVELPGDHLSVANEDPLAATAEGPFISHRVTQAEVDALSDGSSSDSEAEDEQEADKMRENLRIEVERQKLEIEEKSVQQLLEEEYEVVVVGGGVVGCAVLRAMALKNLTCLLLEADENLANGASKGNSGIFHTGFDCTPGSLEAKCVRAGYQEFLQVHEQLHIPVRHTSALVVAWTDADVIELPKLVHKAHQNGCLDVRQITAEELRTMEPNLSPLAKGAVHVPGELITDPNLVPLAYAAEAVHRGAKIITRCKVLGGKFSRNNHNWTLQTSRGTVTGRVVVNCAGLHGDSIEKIPRPDSTPFSIQPRKGQFVILNSPSSSSSSVSTSATTAAAVINATILPVPTARTKGVLIAPTVHGQYIVGPTAEDQEDRERASICAQTCGLIHAKGIEMVPMLSECSVLGYYAGLRPATEHNDYQIEPIESHQWITVAGIRSTGLSAALGIGRHVSRLYGEFFVDLADRRKATVVSPFPKYRITVEPGSNRAILRWGQLTNQITHPLCKISQGLRLAKDSELSWEASVLDLRSSRL
eukprot:GILJ01002803.1.p1 GENE.GILJ01002803.1~~GILJ01002803.1.p1  ORF type:complete len:551 (+),score=74.51 GILJ01002803.1:37-1689(+)